MLKNEKHAPLKVGKVKTGIAKAMLIALTAATVFAACSKNHDVATPALTRTGDLGATPGSSWEPITGPDTTTGQIRYLSGVYEVKDFHQNYSTGAGQPANGNFYWNFYNNEGGSPADYDIHFSGIASGDIVVDQSVGSADSLKYVSNTTFSAVTAANWATATLPNNTSPSQSNKIGMDSTIGAPSYVAALATHQGWYIYDWAAGHLVYPVANRVLLFKDGATGDLYKFQISSLYQGSVTGAAFPYFTFNYQQL
jgi:hypothetical protein